MRERQRIDAGGQEEPSLKWTIKIPGAGDRCTEAPEDGGPGFAVWRCHLLLYSACNSYLFWQGRLSTVESMAQASYRLELQARSFLQLNREISPLVATTT